MTALQLQRAFKKAGIDTTGMTFSRDSVEIFVDNGEGRADEKKTKAAMKRFEKLFKWGGFMSGYGSYILRNNYVNDMGNWNDRCSKHHY